jgi:exonuclease III
VCDFNIPLFPIDRSSRQKFNKETSEINGTIEQIDLTDICRIFHPIAMGYTFFSASNRTFSS